MEIVVNDTQILIDMHSCELLELMKSSSIKFHTVDYVLSELQKSPYSRPEIDQLVNENILIVHSFDVKDNAELIRFYYQYRQYTNLSITDCAVLKYAKDYGYRLLTGDKKLRNQAENNGVMVSGILYLFDKFLEEKLITPHDMADKLEKLLSINTRLPKNIFENKIKELRKRSFAGTTPNNKITSQQDN